MRDALIVNLGTMSYRKAWDLQTQLASLRAAQQIPDVLLAVQHPPVLSLGANFHQQNLLLTDQQYAQKGIEVIRTDRGGDVTYHGPNQLVLYPIFDLRQHGRDVHLWMRSLEETVVQLCREFRIEAVRFPPHTGVWVRNKKLAAIGVKISKWISTHGIAINCNNDLAPFNLIVPCGIVGRGVTSLSKEVQREVKVEEALSIAVPSFEKVYDLHMTSITKEDLEAQVAARK